MNAIVIPSIRTYGQSGTSGSDGRTEGIIGGFSWKFSDTLSISPGVGYFSDLGVEIGGSMALEDAKGRKLAETGVETAMVIGFAFQSRF